MVVDHHADHNKVRCRPITADALVAIAQASDGIRQTGRICKQRITAHTAGLILLTRMLTTDLDELGCGWNGLSTPSGLARWARRWWTTPDSSDLATDQKVGGSSPSERATETPGQRHHALIPEVPSSSSGRIWPHQHLQRPHKS